MIKIPITKILFLDIETVGICKDWSSCQESHPKVAEQFIKYFDWFLKRFPEDNVPTEGLQEELDKIKNDFIKDIKNIKKDTIFKEVVTKKLTLWGRIKKVLTGI